MTPVDEAQIAAQLKKWALAEGFDRVGIATLGPPQHAEHFVHWLEQGFHGGMEYLARRSGERLRPREIMAEARSVLCVALQYYPAPSTDDSSPRSGDLWPRVARYARGRDYHEVMDKRLRRLAHRVEEAFPGSSTRPYVDTGPVLERELAARAGLGAFGKNTNLLHPEAGSWFLLGELFLSLSLKEDTPLADMCGSCTACLDACPTAALVAPYVLDSTRCISYWTIEHRGSIPVAARHGLGEWVFGCDVCQEVCPANVDPLLAGDQELLAVEGRFDLDLEDLLRMDQESYRTVFGRTALSRAKFEGLKRNAAVAIGNSKSERYLPVLAEALNDESPVVRSHAGWALGRIGGTDAQRLLHRALSEEEDSSVRQELLAASGAVVVESVPEGETGPG